MVVSRGNISWNCRVFLKSIVKCPSSVPWALLLLLPLHYRRRGCREEEGEKNFFRPFFFPLRYSYLTPLLLLFLPSPPFASFLVNLHIQPASARHAGSCSLSLSLSPSLSHKAMLRSLSLRGSTPLPLPRRYGNGGTRTKADHDIKAGGATNSLNQVANSTEHLIYTLHFLNFIFP